MDERDFYPAGIVYSATMSPRTRATRLAVPLALALAAVVAMTARAAGPSVSIVDFAYRPATITIAAGEAVTWTNNGATQHTVTADDGSFDSGPLSHGDAFTNVLATPGRYAYHCTIHPTRMRGTVIVTAAAATAAPSGSVLTPPAGTLPPGFSPGVPSAGATPSAAPSSVPTDANAQGQSWVLPLLVVLVLVALVAGFLFLRRRRDSQRP